MPLNTVSAAVHITPVVVATFFKHFGRRIQTKRLPEHDDDEAIDWLLYDEAFNIVRAFIELGTKNTVESLQAFTNTHVPSPYWATVIPTLISIESCNQAAEALKSWFSSQELSSVAGGEQWWQVRGLEGVEAEWVAMYADVHGKRGSRTKSIDKTQVEHGKRKSKAKLKRSDITKEDTEKMDKLERVMLYIHGGGFYWGSINTHRYQIIRFARKFAGRCFAVNYRKAPQYPWPCPLHDALAAYLYLIRPPLGSSHTAIDPKRIVIAGDSAGGNLALTCLTVLRDLELPMPAGAVLISPWVDLTHSFPSIMDNAPTDIIPPHGFIHKPSTLWPLPTGSNKNTSDFPVNNRLLNKNGANDEETNAPNGGPKSPISYMVPLCKALHDLELRSQIQFYAENHQLAHPLVSPLLHSSLGGLCPLYIMTGNDEVLRDEVIYLAHRAAQPSNYPLREELRQKTSRQAENESKYSIGTSVRLQVFDGMCHVGPTVFSFTKQAAYAYRAIGQFVRHVTTRSEEELSKNPFPRTMVDKRQGTLDNPTTDITALDFANTHKPSVTSFNFSSGADIQSSDHGSQVKHHGMVRERIDVYGKPRPLEPATHLPALQLDPEEIGVLKEGPVNRWRSGQDEWDTKYKRAAKSAKAKREKLTEKAEHLLALLNEQGLEGQTTRWSPASLSEESIPPTAIVGRKDTDDALVLLRTLFPPVHAAPSRFATLSRAWRKDSPVQPTRVSASEQQVKADMIPVHGLSMWSQLMSYFIKRSTKNVKDHSDENKSKDATAHEHDDEGSILSEATHRSH